jgi:hypothetical protein
MPYFPACDWMAFSICSLTAAIPTNWLDLLTDGAVWQQS